MEHAAARAPAIIPALDGFRGYAALLVLVLHCWFFAGLPHLDDGALRAVIAAGGLAVDYFFVISGFALFLPAVRRGAFGDVRAYAIRRAARIAPAYYVSLAALVLLYPALTGQPTPFRTGGGVASLLLHVAFLQYEAPAWLLRLIGAPTEVGFGVNGVLWSLSIELFFYVALPLVAAAYARRPFVALAAALGAALAWRALALHLPPVATLVGMQADSTPGRPRLFTQFPGYLGHFALGMTGAVVFVRLWGRNATAGPGLRALVPVVQVTSLGALLYGMAAVGGCQLANDCSTWSARYLRDLIPAGAFAVLLVATSLASPRGQWPCANRLARWLGDVSYGVYLWHAMLLHFFMQHFAIERDGRAATFAVLTALVLPAALLVGWLSHRFVEAPAMAYARAWAAARARGAGSPAAAAGPHAA